MEVFSFLLKIAILLIDKFSILKLLVVSSQIINILEEISFIDKIVLVSIELSVIIIVVNFILESKDSGFNSSIIESTFFSV